MQVYRIDYTSGLAASIQAFIFMLYYYNNWSIQLLFLSLNRVMIRDHTQYASPVGFPV